MFTPGQMQMQSATLLQGYAGDRPSFEAIVCRTFMANIPVQVFALPQGLLFLEIKNKPGSGGGGGNNTNAIVIGAVLGGAVGACIAGALAGSAEVAGAMKENFDMCGEEELFELASRRRRSFVSKNDEIQAITIDAPGSWSLFAPSTLAGWITIRDRKLGKIAMEIHDQAAMSVAVDALPRRFAERIFVNVEFDRNSTRFRPRGR